MTIQRLTKKQASIIGCYTGITCGPFSDVHKEAEILMERPVWVHEFANEEFMANLRSKAQPDFLAICYKDMEE